MLTCKKCGRRKGKRDCPALGDRICPQCCGRHRLREISCPSDCVYLEGAARDRAREAERADAALDVYKRERAGTFSAPAELHLAFLLEGVCYAWWKDHSAASAEDVAGSYERAGRMLGRIALPDDGRDPLAQLLAEARERFPELTEMRSPPSRESCAKVLSSLSEFARRYERTTSPWKGYFRGLEYVYSRTGPPRQATAETEESRRSSLFIPGRSRPAPARGPQGGGLILPG